jgi:hypothetical protein
MIHMPCHQHEREELRDLRQCGSDSELARALRDRPRTDLRPPSVSANAIEAKSIARTVGTAAGPMTRGAVAPRTECGRRQRFVEQAHSVSQQQASKVQASPSEGRRASQASAIAATSNHRRGRVRRLPEQPRVAHDADASAAVGSCDR